jgi:hypothetical protein
VLVPHAVEPVELVIDPRVITLMVGPVVDIASGLA